MRRTIGFLAVVLLTSAVSIARSGATTSPGVPIPPGFGPRGATAPVALADNADGSMPAIIGPPPSPLPAPAPPPIIGPPAPAPPPSPPVTTTVTTTSTTTSLTETTSSTVAVATTTTTTASPGCPTTATLSSVSCRLSELIDAAGSAPGGRVRDSLLKRLGGAQTATTEAGQLVTSGTKKKVGQRLRVAIRKLKQASALLRSRRAKGAFDDATRAALGADADAIRNDLTTLRSNALQGIQISAVPRAAAWGS